MTGLTVLNVVRSVGLTHQLVNLVREERAVDRGHLEDASVVTAADVLKKRMSAFLVRVNNVGLSTSSTSERPQHRLQTQP